MPHTVLIVDDSPTAVPELRHVLEDQGFQVLSALRAEEALDMLRDEHVDLVITEALLSGMDGFEMVRRIRHENREWTRVPIIMLTVRSGPEDYAASYSAGVDEYFLKPLDAPKILAAGRGLIARFEAAVQAGSLVTLGSPINPAPVVHSRGGKIISVFSLKGGVGTSTIAVNIAVAIKVAAPSARVGLIDLSLEEAIDGLLLDIVPTSTIADWAREDMGKATARHLNEYFVAHRSGINLMGGPQSPEQAETIPPAVVRTTLQMAPEIFDYLVLDTSSAFSEISLIALEASESIVLPLTPDMAALKTAVNTLRILKAVNIEESRLTFVLNEIVPRAGLPPAQIEASLGIAPRLLPHAGSAFIDAINQGTPVVMQQPSLTSSRALIELARSLCTPETTESALQQEGLLGRLRSVRGGARSRRAESS